MRRVTITSVLNLRLRQIVKSDGGYRNSYFISVVVCRIVLTMITLHCPLCLATFFLDNICVATLSTPFPTNAQFVVEPFDAIPTITVIEVTKIITLISAKSSPLDFVATSVVKFCVTVFADLIARLANLSFSQGVFL